MKGGPTDPPNCHETGFHMGSNTASMKGGPTDPPNYPINHMTDTQRRSLQ